MVIFTRAPLLAPPPAQAPEDLRHAGIRRDDDVRPALGDQPPQPAAAQRHADDPGQRADRRHLGDQPVGQVEQAVAPDRLE